jgi:ribonuclease D
VETKKQHTSFRKSELLGSGCPRSLKTLTVHEHDLSTRAYCSIIGWNIVEIDTETDGLDFRKNKLLLVQLSNGQGNVHIVRRPDRESQTLTSILAMSKKVFHYMMFDLRFIKAHIHPRLEGYNSLCTKTLMKIVHPDKSAGLQASLRDVLKVNISKKHQTSNWDAKKLSRSQLCYAATDVIYLNKLHNTLEAKLTPHEKEIYKTALQTIRSKASLEVEGYTGLLDYEKDNAEEVLANRNWWVHQKHKMERK